MKHLFTVFTLFCALAGCHYPHRTLPGDTAYYEYEIDSTTEVYTSVVAGSQRLVDLPPGTVVIVQGTPLAGSFVDVIYDGYQLRVNDPVWRRRSVIAYERPVHFKSPAALPLYSSWVLGRTAVHTRPAVHASSLRDGQTIVSSDRDGYTPSTGATIQTGPRGGRFYINSHGNKTYLKSSRSSSGSFSRPSRSSGGRRR